MTTSKLETPLKKRLNCRRGASHSECLARQTDTAVWPILDCSLAVYSFNKYQLSIIHTCRLASKVKYASICIAHFTAKPQMRSDMDHTVLPANYTMPAFTPQPQNITGLWLVLILPSHGE